MDLVASYCSDSEIEELKPCPTKEIDLINVLDSDTEDCTSLDKRVDEKSETLKDKVVDSSNNSEKIDLIELDESDEEMHRDVKKCTEDAINIIEKCLSENENSTKQVDYLNLDGSDSEGEQNITLNKLEELHSSACALSDVPCGPVKPAEEDKLCEQNAIESSAVERQTELDIEDASKSTGEISHSDEILSKVPHECISESVSDSMDEQSRKKFKCDQTSNEDIKTDYESSEAENFSVTDTYIYRKDDTFTRSYFRHLVCHIPNHICRTYIAHTNVVTALNWCIPQYSHLLLSASADCSLKIWDIHCKNPVRCFKNSSGLKAAKWSVDGEQVVAGGYGKKAHVFDILSGKEIFAYDVFNYVTCIQIHPEIRDFFLCGTRNAILGYDLRVNSTLPVKTFFSNCEEVLDIIFVAQDEFICSTNIVTRDSADRTIMAWNFPTGAIMSNQIYLERYTCPSLKFHPYESVFLAQTNGDYIAAFSAHRPYKMKNRRYVGHKVSGFGIECDVSPDGKYVTTGDADGEIYFYNYITSNVHKKLTVKSNVPVNRLLWHPFFPSTIATATWDGHLQIWK